MATPLVPVAGEIAETVNGLLEIFGCVTGSVAASLRTGPVPLDPLLHAETTDASTTAPISNEDRLRRSVSNAIAAFAT
ncbi:MAG TPA: hypothetical protein VGN81_19405 [Pseudonocardiaceae bacterium]